MDQNVAQAVELGTWIGRGQAFGLVANLSLAGQARCLRTIRESGSYKTLGLTWEQFCPEYAGLTRRTVDQLIENLDEFGETYFRISEILRISPESYRQIAPRIAGDGETIEIDGEAVAIAPANASRIRRAVQQIRAELRKAQAEAQVQQHSVPNLANLTSRLDLCLEEISRVTDHPLEARDETGLRNLISHANGRLKRISHSIQRAQPVLDE